MILRIGTDCVAHGVRRKKKLSPAFTLVEVMVATAILSLGIVLIYQAFFISIDSFNYCFNYLNVASWADEKIWQVQNNLSHSKVEDIIETGGRFRKRNKDFNWDLSYYLIDVDLYRIDLDIFWQQGRRKAMLYRNAYAVYDGE